MKAYSSPAGVKIRFTGTPSIIVTIVTILGSDAIFTLILASIIILILLSVMQRSVTKGIVIFIPIFLGLIWTMGTLGWLDIAISFATAGLGAMILGLGVEYGIFMFTRYKEEKDRGLNQEEALLIAVPSIGSAVLGSGTTTIVGFLALTLSIMPMLQNLGLSLALGIFYCIISSLIIGPIIVIFEEDFEEWYNMHRFDKLSKKINKKNGERQ
ncbi:hypothetical protein COV93_05020 [Candidatus Woesearchaeota archaeon CG11_big_fil_rev_8_21_14_0_20_43_8]|nr:MAG: hypothetical protein COV93_05020 [Candidatus Woesearchaeota archaeon CG11_big_fil_rev_8_21_14_0_20_43_8]